MAEPDGGAADAPRVLIVTDSASARFGGEACLPLHYFRILRQRGVEAWLVAHSRTQTELLELLPGEAGRMHFLPDTALVKRAARLASYLPSRLSYITIGYVCRLSTQRSARRLARRLVAEYGVDVVHQPTPVSPREPSLLHRMGAPVVIGPMNGGMTYPPAFERRSAGLRAVGAVVNLARMATGLLNWMMPGKLHAAALLVANERTRRALPAGARGEVVTLIENGVDLDIWGPPARPPAADGPARFVFLGRLVDWKAVDLLIEAFARVVATHPATLEIVGDGRMRPALEAQAARLGLGDRVVFAGWQPQAEAACRLREADALVLPSLYECGGAVVLEAMACGLPVIATEWGGPTDYLDATCGILVPPDSPAGFVSGLADAMSRLAADPALRSELGRAGRDRVIREFDWEIKVDRMLDVYRSAAAASHRPTVSQGAGR
jgi:glycosyltransferase involved in cell wall biosynthesis